MFMRRCDLAGTEGRRRALVDFSGLWERWEPIRDAARFPHYGCPSLKCKVPTAFPISPSSPQKPSVSPSTPACMDESRGVVRGGLKADVCVPCSARPFVCGCHIISTMLRFHTPLIEPDRQISRIRLSDKAYSIEIFPPRHGRRLVLVVVVIASGTSQPLMEFIGSRQSPGCLSRPQMGLQRGPLPSTGVTRLQRYYEPLRHPGRPGLSLAGVR